jgi:hypothetical protein
MTDRRGMTDKRAAAFVDAALRLAAHMDACEEIEIYNEPQRRMLEAYRKLNKTGLPYYGEVTRRDH